MTDKPLAILGSIPCDSHSWNLVFLQLFLVEQGFDVLNLGPCTPYDLTIEKCAEHAPTVLVISSVNGHGAIEAVELGRRVASLPSRSFPTVIGGKLWLDGLAGGARADELTRSGFDHVFDDQPESLERFAELLRELGPSVELGDLPGVAHVEGYA